LALFEINIFQLQIWRKFTPKIKTLHEVSSVCEATTAQRQTEMERRGEEWCIWSSQEGFVVLVSVFQEKANVL
jgi:hypothetical protein